jgi:hypothetical protein
VALNSHRVTIYRETRQITVSLMYLLAYRKDLLLLQGIHWQ